MLVGISCSAQTSYHISTGQGLSTNQLTVSIKDSNQADDQISYIISIFQDDTDDIWVVTEAGLFVVNCLFIERRYHKTQKR